MLSVARTDPDIKFICTASDVATGKNAFSLDVLARPAVSASEAASACASAHFQQNGTQNNQH